MKHNLLVLAGLIIITSCGGKKEEPKKISSGYSLKNIKELVGIARIEPENKISPIGAEIAGRVVDIFVSEGEPIKKGQLILLMDDSAESAQVDQSNSKIATRNQRVSILQAKLEAITIKVDAADVERKRDRALADANAGTEKAAMDSEAAYNNLRAELIIAQADLQEAKAAVNEVSSETKYIIKMRDKKRIYAPSDGMMLNWDVKLGQAIGAGTKLGDFAPAGGLIAITEVDELYALKVKKGQHVSINLQGTKQTLTSGSVVYCAPYLSKKSIFSDRADNLEDRRVREVRVRVDDPSAVLIGSRMECIIKL